MKILLACEHFYPLGGGVAKMMNEIGKYLVLFGHEVSIATSYSKQRTNLIRDGIKILQFDVRGNSVNGLIGDVDKYQDFLKISDFEVIIVMAAQQWALDAMLPILDQIKAKKVHIPCGYSSFYLREYQDYYEEMKNHILKFDALIYNASSYRDINFARDAGAKNINIIPPGASEEEFLTRPKLDIRNQLNIPTDNLILLSVGAPAFHKGHGDVLRAYLKATIDKKSVLVLNGDYDKKPWRGARDIAKEIILTLLGKSPRAIKFLAKKNRDPMKRILFTNLKRDELISLFFESDAFIFASHIEYSPLVIYECMAAGLPFLSTPVGNVEEIVGWTNAGKICYDAKFEDGRTYVKSDSFAIEIENFIKDQSQLKLYSKNGKEAFMNRFNWRSFSSEINKLIQAI